MSYNKLRNINDFRNDKVFFSKQFIKCLTEEFSITQLKYNLNGEPNIAYFELYINDFKNNIELRYSELKFEKFKTQLDNTIICIYDLHINIIDVLISAYNLDGKKIIFSLSQYFDNLYTIKQNNISFSLNKTSSDYNELNDIYKFLFETLKYLQFHINKILFIDIENTPLKYSFKKTLASIKNNINKDFYVKNKLHNEVNLTFVDFIRKIPPSQIKGFTLELVTQFNKEKGKPFATMLNILYSKGVLAFNDGQCKSLHEILEKLFTQDIGSYKTFNRNFPKYIEEELFESNNDAIKQVREIKYINTKLIPLLNKYLQN